MNRRTTHTLLALGAIVLAGIAAATGFAAVTATHSVSSPDQRSPKLAPAASPSLWQ
jgi:hypothetical protein